MTQDLLEEAAQPRDEITERIAAIARIIDERGGYEYMRHRTEHGINVGDEQFIDHVADSVWDFERGDTVSALSRLQMLYYGSEQPPYRGFKFVEFLVHWFQHPDLEDCLETRRHHGKRLARTTEVATEPDDLI